MTGSGLSYDASGNVTNDGNHTYQYDAEGRLYSVVEVGICYLYDADNDRVGENDCSKGNKADFLYDINHRRMTQLNLSNYSLQQANIYAGGELLAEDAPDAYATNTPTASLLRITNQVGTLGSRWDQGANWDGECNSFPYGDGMTCSIPEPSTALFTGKDRDSESAGPSALSGLDYFGARYYSSQLGRFISPDPLPWIHWQRGDEDNQKKFAAYIANPQNLNMYTYVLNNPLSKIDPTGMNACGTNNDSSCKVTVAIQDRSKDANGEYNDQYTGVKNQGNYNATAVVNVNGKDVGTFLIKTTPSDSNSGASLASGVYSGTLTEHNGHEAIRIQPTNDLPTNGPNPTHGGAWFAQGDLIHQAGVNNFTGVGRDGRAVSNGCLVVCTSQFGDFSTATGMNANPPQRHFTVDVDTSANQWNVSQ